MVSTLSSFKSNDLTMHKHKTLNSYSWPRKKGLRREAGDAKVWLCSWQSLGDLSGAHAIEGRRVLGQEISLGEAWATSPRPVWELEQ